ncbi:MAG: hypothetical protein ACI4U0_05815 [Candidatus Aphodocola sp.]
MKEIKKVDDNEIQRRKRSMKILRTLMIILDVLALTLLIVQIVIKDISYWSYVILVLCNIITFSVRVEPKSKAGKK